MKGNDGRTTFRQFDLCEDLGYLPFLQSQEGQTTEMAKQIGLGPTLFLISTRAFSWFFVFLTIVNIPIFLFYSISNSDASQGESYQSIFSYFSLGNVGSNDFSCETMDLANVIDMKNNGASAEELYFEQVAELECGMGEFRKLSYIGVFPDSEYNC